MSFMELFALRKAKLGGKYQAPKGVTERELQEVGEEMMEGVRGDPGVHKSFHPTIRDGSTWRKFGARGEHGDVLWFSTEVFSGSPT